MKHFPLARPLFALGLAAILALAAPAGAAAQGGIDAVERVEAYLRSVRTIDSDFVQSSSNGESARGRLYVERPGSLRLDYAPPTTLQIFVNGSWLIYVDTRLEEVTHVPLARTPAAFLVGDDVSFSGKMEVDKVAVDAQTIRIQVVQTEDPESGSVILTFGRQPMVLKNWTVIDAQGVQTRVALVKPRFNGPVDRSVFDFDPDKYIRTQTGE